MFGTKKNYHIRIEYMSDIQTSHEGSYVKIVFSYRLNGTRYVVEDIIPSNWRDAFPTKYVNNWMYQYVKAEDKRLENSRELRRRMR